MNQEHQARQQQTSNPIAEASRRQWINAVEKMADDEKVKARIECLEREVAAHTLVNWQSL